MRRWLLLLVSIILLVPSAGSGVDDSDEFIIDFDRRVPMRDGVELSADVYRPAAEGRFPVILARTPYTKSIDKVLELGGYFASQGYVFVAMDVRGRGDSDGVFIPYRNEGLDGYDSIEWCAGKPWSNGKVGTIGGSYLGMVQFLAALHQPPHLITMIPMVTPSDPFVEFPTGLPIPMTINWQHFVAGHVNQNPAAVDWTRIYEHLPVYTMDEAAGRPNPRWKKTIEHAVLDEWWEPLRYQNKFDRIDVPILHISGWYDDEQIGTPLNYIGMTTEGPARVRESQKLLMGPWPHGVMSAKRKLGEIDFGPDAVMDLKAYCLRWFDYWLKGEDNGIMEEPPVRIFIMGENRWTEESEWPLAATEWTEYHLRGDGRLSTERPSEETADSYIYDPSDPVPFITDTFFSQLGGPDDYSEVEKRDDVLVYTSRKIKKKTVICGPVKMKLYASSSATDTDFMAKLLDVWPNGFAQRLTDGMVRARFREGMDRPSLIEPGQIYLFDIDLWNTCQTFKRGHRIRVEIASSAFPKYDRNPNTGEPLGMTANMQVAEQTIYHDTEHPSHIVLPVIPD